MLVLSALLSFSTPPPVGNILCQALRRERSGGAEINTTADSSGLGDEVLAAIQQAEDRGRGRAPLAGLCAAQLLQLAAESAASADCPPRLLVLGARLLQALHQVAQDATQAELCLGASLTGAALCTAARECRVRAADGEQLVIGQRLEAISCDLVSSAAEALKNVGAAGTDPASVQRFLQCCEADAGRLVRASGELEAALFPNIDRVVGCWLFGEVAGWGQHVNLVR